MEWNDKGVILDVRRHGENSAIVNLLTPNHGRHAGLVRGATSKTMRGVLQSGNTVDAKWRARLPEHLGNYALETLKVRAIALLESGSALDALNAACAIAMVALPEREAHQAVFDGLEVLLDNLDDESMWPALLIRWEAGLLQELGFGLDLSTCAATGEIDDLVFVSPKTGRAVSAAAGAPYKEKLLPLPSFLVGGAGGSPTHQEIRDGFLLTGYFLERWVLAPHGVKMPEARGRLIDRLFR